MHKVHTGTGRELEQAAERELMIVTLKKNLLKKTAKKRRHLSSSGLDSKEIILKSFKGWFCVWFGSKLWILFAFQPVKSQQQPTDLKTTKKLKKR
uniref:Uncharacterized protein n=1 Tax=Ditylenchus dipsaci TaxID=166011 RepID=A0A915EAQ8_9BILA